MIKTDQTIRIVYWNSMAQDNLEAVGLMAMEKKYYK